MEPSTVTGNETGGPADLAAGGRGGQDAGAPGRQQGSAQSAGFTLIEVIVVMAIIVVLSAIGLAGYRNSLLQSREAALAQDLFQMREAIDQYYADKNKYPASLQDLVGEKYLRMVPMDPFTNTSDWQTVLAEPDPRNPSAEIGIYDVKSGASGTGQNGKPYAEW